MNKYTNIAVLAILAAFSFTVPANADVISFDNLNATSVDADSLAAVGPIAGSFSTSAFASKLSQVSFKLSGTADAGSVTVQLLSDSSSSPGSVLGTIGTLSDSLLTGTLSNFTVIPSTTFNLLASTRYWIQLVSNSSSANWAWSEDISGPGVAGQFIANTNGVFANSTEAPYQMQVLTIAPEPSYGILSFGILGILFFATRKRRTA